MVLDSAFCKYKFIRCTCLGPSLLSRIEVQCVTVSVHVWVGGDGLRGGGVGGSYQPGVSVPLKALFLVFLGLMMLVHPIKTVVLDVFGTGKTQIAVKMSGS